MAYFTLCTKTDGKWFPQFGDYDRDCVEQERIDSYADVKKADTKIVTTKSARKSEVDQAIAALNTNESALRALHNITP